MIDRFYGVDLVISRYVPRGKAFVMHGSVVMHPVDRLHMQYPKSPVWGTRTLGHREMERDRRKYGKSN